MQTGWGRQTDIIHYEPPQRSISLRLLNFGVKTAWNRVFRRPARVPVHKHSLPEQCSESDNFILGEQLNLDGPFPPYSQWNGPDTLSCRDEGCGETGDLFECHFDAPFFHRNHTVTLHPPLSSENQGHCNLVRISIPSKNRDGWPIPKAKNCSDYLSTATIKSTQKLWDFQIQSR
jgi:hypothetical protein